MNIVDGQGWPDFCLLQTVNEDTFFENLNTRFKERQIYTYIGEQVVSMNPFQKMDNTSEAVMNEYKKKYMYEVQPHVFALAEDTYTSLMTNRTDQCVIVTGESGAGKTEASKIFMSYLAKISGKNEHAERIKGRLLDSNPVLESFGNAKTVRNDNSSRFGKYMEIQFDGAGAPQAGKISQYLLEKSRVVTRAADERSFHIFYFLLSQKHMLADLNLDPDHSKYHYLNLSGCYTVPNMNDSREFEDVTNAMTSLGFEDSNKKSVWSFLSAILNLGNIKFEPDNSVQGTDASKITNKDVLAIVSKLLSVDEKVLEKAMVTRSITTGAGGANSNIDVFLTVDQAEFSRDSLAKSLYDKMFDWVVMRVNDAIESTKRPEIIVGVLDIYGFEIFEHNSFEQFCINYCNEKLQQLFIELVLKQEQEEYIREGIEWTPIDYFDNGPICQLIEGKTGIYRMLDDTCMVGKSTPNDFLDKLDASEIGKHPHYGSFRATKDKTIDRDSFRIKHYAGVVDYEVKGFIFKNQDTLWGSLKEAMQASSDSLMKNLFPVEKVRSKARPVTAGTNFTKSVQELIVKLQSCQPHYIRCIKPNDQKRGFTMNEERVRHQCRYLNLVETVRVRKAGFCARRPYTRFLPRYKMLSKETWPIWRGTDQQGVQKIFDSLGIEAAEYRMGRTKVFIKDAMTIVKIERARAENLPIVAIKIQALFRGYRDRKWVREHRSKLALMRHAGRIQAMYIRYKIRKYFRGCLEGYRAVQHDNFGKHFQIPAPDPVFARGLPYMQKILHNDWARRKVMSLTPEQQGRMRQKVLALTIFSGKKPWNVSRSFDADYCNVPKNPNLAEYKQAVEQLFQAGGDQKILFSDTVAKVNRKAQAQVRALILTDKNIYKYEPKKYKMKKEAIPLNSVVSVHCSTKDDCYVIIKVLKNQDLPVTFEDKITFNNSRAPGKEGAAGTLVFEKNNNPKSPRLPGKEMRRLSLLALSLDNASVFKKTSAGNYVVQY